METWKRWQKLMAFSQFDSQVRVWCASKDINPSDVHVRIEWFSELVTCDVYLVPEEEVEVTFEITLDWTTKLSSVFSTLGVDGGGLFTLAYGTPHLEVPPGAGMRLGPIGLIR